jgi:hypothetical protein
VATQPRPNTDFIAGTIENMFDFDQFPFLRFVPDPQTGEVVRQL